MSSDIYESTETVLFELTLPATRYRTPEAIASFVDRFESGLQSVAPSAVVGAANLTPGIPSRRSVDGISLARRGGPVQRGVTEVLVSHRFLDAVGVSPLAGRHFTRGDEVGREVILLSREAARLLETQPISTVGLMVEIGGEPATVVGVVGEVGTPVVYRLLNRAPPPTDLIVGVHWEHTLGLSQQLLQNVVWGIDPSLPIYDLMTMEFAIARAGLMEGLVVKGTLFSALLALALCAGGVYSVACSYERGRMRETAVRVMLGADGRALRNTIVARSGIVALGVASATGLCHWALFRAAIVYDYGSVPEATAVMLAVSAVGGTILVAGATFLAVRRVPQIDAATLLRSHG